MNSMEVHRNKIFLGVRGSSGADALNGRAGLVTLLAPPGRLVTMDERRAEVGGEWCRAWVNCQDGLDG